MACHCCELLDADRRQLLAAAKSDRDRLSLLLTPPDDREIRDLALLGAADPSAKGRAALAPPGAGPRGGEPVPDAGRVLTSVGAGGEDEQLGWRQPGRQRALM